LRHWAASLSQFLTNALSFRKCAGATRGWRRNGYDRTNLVEKHRHQPAVLTKRGRQGLRLELKAVNMTDHGKEFAPEMAKTRKFRGGRFLRGPVGLTMALPWA